MACDMYSSAKAQKLLHRKTIFLFGDSNIRAMYKDLLWLLENGTLIPESRLKSKNETSHCNDVRLSQGILHSGRNYREVRVYDEDSYITFHFITRLHTPYFVDTIKALATTPDAIILNSCLWDLTRWGSNGVADFKINLVKTFTFLKQEFPSTRIIWLTTLPPTFQAHGGFLTKEVEFMRNMLPWHILFANKYSSDIAYSYNIDVLDLHYSFRFLLNHHSKDGIHWSTAAVRYAVNMLLTHLALVWNYSLPGEFILDKKFLEQNEIMSSNPPTDASARCNSKSTSNRRKNYTRNKRNRNRFRNYNNNKVFPQTNSPKKEIPSLLNSFSFVNNFQKVFGDSSNTQMSLPNNENIWATDLVCNNFENAHSNIKKVVDEVKVNAYQCTFDSQNNQQSQANANRISKDRRQRGGFRLVDMFRNYFY